MREAEEAGGETADQRLGFSFFFPSQPHNFKRRGDASDIRSLCKHTQWGFVQPPPASGGGETRFQKLSENTRFRSRRRKITRKHAAEGIFSAKVLVAVSSRPDPTLLVNNEWLKNGWLGAVTH